MGSIPWTSVYFVKAIIDLLQMKKLPEQDYEAGYFVHCKMCICYREVNDDKSKKHVGRTYPSQGNAINFIEEEEFKERTRVHHCLLMFEIIET